MNDSPFSAERVSRSATILLEGPIDTVFPLFGPVEESKWEDGWNPVILYPKSGELEEGMVFTSPARGYGEAQYAWIVSKYQAENHIIEYIVSTANRYWVIAVHCNDVSDEQTRATVRYTYTGLTSLGNDINRHAIEFMYRNNLKDWEEAINHYLRTGTTLKRR